MKNSDFFKISNTTQKRARNIFPAKVVKTAISLFETCNKGVVESEFIGDSDNETLKECLQFMINRTNACNL